MSDKFKMDEFEAIFITILAGIIATCCAIVYFYDIKELYTALGLVLPILVTIALMILASMME